MNTPILALPDGPERDEAAQRLRVTTLMHRERLFAGKTGDDATVRLSDGEGHIRLQLNVTAAGEASIEFLDSAGAVVRSFPD